MATSLTHKKISLCMISLNEEPFIARALENVKPYVDEIIIVDGGSRDKTVEIAKNFGAKVYYSQWKNNFSKQRDISLKYATGDWILIMDPDEIYEKGFLDRLQLYANNNIGVNMFAVPRKNYIGGKQTNAYPDRQLRFFPNHHGIRYKKRVHEVPTGYNLIASPTNLHIIHKKTSRRQAKQNAYYATLERKKAKSA